MNIIGLAGPIGVGKTTTARTIQRMVPDSVILSFAFPVKHIAREFFGWKGEKDERGRKLLQMLGTDVGRAFDPDIWVRHMLKEISDLRELEPEPPPLILIDDVRFDNEAAALRCEDLKGKVVQLYGRGAILMTDDHVSERGVSRTLTDFAVNAGSRTPLEVATLVLQITNLDQLATAQGA